MSAEQNKETVRRWIEEVWNTGNAGLIDDLMDENMRDHNPIPGLPAGRAARKQILAMFHAAFDVQIKLDLLLADGHHFVVDRPIAEVAGPGTLSRPAPDRQQSGDRRGGLASGHLCHGWLW